MYGLKNFGTSLEVVITYIYINLQLWKKILENCLYYGWSMVPNSQPLPKINNLTIFTIIVKTYLEIQSKIKCYSHSY